MIEVGKSFISIIEQRRGEKLTTCMCNAFLQVPRHLFVPQYYQQQENSLLWKLVPATLDTVYQDEAFVTQIDGRGIPSSSTSQPSALAVQLEALALAPGQRVLEIGAGTGYNAALMGVMVGETGQVISLDIDEEVAEQAQRHLTLASVKNVLAISSDGFLGEAAYAPYDCIIATCSVRFIPLPWFEQLKPGGRFVGNWRLPLASLFVAVSKTSTGELTGAFLDLDAAYMEMQGKDRKPTKQKIDWASFDAHPAGFIELPNALTWFHNPAYTLLLQCFCPHLGKRYRSTKEEQISLYLLTGETAIQVKEDRLHFFGDAKIGSIMQQSLELYQQLGQPHLTQYRVTFQERQAVLHIGNQHLQLPLF